MAKILVTGGAGYLGAVLVPRLLRVGHDVTVLDSLMYDQNPLLDCCADTRFNFVVGDVCNESLMTKLLPHFDFVVSCAAIVGPLAGVTNPVRAKMVNYDAVIMLLKKLSKSQTLLFPSTDSCYGTAGGDDPRTESSPLFPRSEYARTRVEVERRLLDQGNAISFRMGTAFGMSPRMRLDLMVNDFTYRSLRDRALVLFGAESRRNFIHVRDMAKAFVFAVENSVRMRGQAFNVGLTGTNLTKMEVAKKVQGLVPELYVHAAESSQFLDNRTHTIDSGKLETLGWKPDFSLDEGIVELLKGYLIISPRGFSRL